MLRTISLDGLELSIEPLEVVVAHLAELAKGDSPKLLATPNVDFYVRWRRDKRFRALCERASALVPDGYPIARLAQWKARTSVQRVTGTDVFNRLCSVAIEHDLTISLLGGEAGVGELAIRNLQARYGSFRVGVVTAPLASDLSDSRYLARLADEISSYENNVVAICLGSPKQEELFAELVDRGELRGGGVFLGVGAAVDFFAGRIARAPVLLRRIGLEWLFRLAKEPRRLLRRYATDAALFPFYALQEVIVELKARRSLR